MKHHISYTFFFLIVCLFFSGVFHMQKEIRNVLLFHGDLGLHSTSSQLQARLDTVLLEDTIVKLQEKISSLEEHTYADSKEREQYLRHSNRKYGMRRNHEFDEKLACYTRSIEAPIIRKSLTEYAAFIFIGKGRFDDPHSNTLKVDSPVVYGNTLIGVVEEIEDRISKVRLLTDARMVVPSRAIRGGRSLSHVQAKARGLYSLLDEDSPLGEEILAFLRRDGCDETVHAKGCIQGGGLPFLGRRVPYLQATNFSGFYRDEDSSSRDIYGKEYTLKKTPSLAILAKGDIIVTTGEEGVFPPGLAIGIVSSCPTTKDGVTLDAHVAPLISLQEISGVTIISPYRERRD